MAHTHTYMNIHECSRKGANHPDSTPERNGTHTHAGMLMEERNDTHTHTSRNALGMTQTNPDSTQRGMEMAHTLTHTRRNALGGEE